MNPKDPHVVLPTCKPYTARPVETAKEPGDGEDGDGEGGDGEEQEPDEPEPEPEPVPLPFLGFCTGR